MLKDVLRKLSTVLINLIIVLAMIINFCFFIVIAALLIIFRIFTLPIELLFNRISSLNNDNNETK